MLDSVDTQTLISTFATAASAVFAGLSARAVRIQTEQSNKLSLFNRRMNIWKIVRGLMSLCKDNLGHLSERKKETYFSNESLFEEMTNNSYLCDVTDAIHKTLEPEPQQLLLKKIEEMRDIASESGMLFNKRTSLLLSSFINDYQAFLFSSYQYQIMLNEMKNYNENAHKNKTLDEISEILGEPSRRKELYNYEDKLLSSFNKLNEARIEDLIMKQIRV